MLTYYQRRAVGETLQQVGHTPSRDVWVSGTDVDADDLARVVDQFDLDPNVVHDVSDRDELPRVEYASEALYVFVRTPHRTTHGDVVTAPMLMIMKDAAYISLSRDGFEAPDKITAPSRIDHIPTLVLATIAAVAADYEALIRRTGKYIQDTERRLRTHEVDNHDFVKFVTIESNLNAHHTNLSSILAVLDRLKENRHDLFLASDCEATDDIILHVRQLLVAVDSHSQAITSIRNAYSTIANNSLNQRMKTLTVLTVLIALPNVFYGMYGMNVALPMAEEPWAYFAVVGFSLLLILIVYTLAKRFRIF